MNTMNTILVIDKNHTIHNIPTRYCETWYPVKICNCTVPMLDVSTKNIEHLLLFYDHYSNCTTVGETYVNNKLQRVDPFNNDLFNDSNYSRWCLKEYINDYFSDEWSLKWVEEISKDKKEFFNFIIDLDYLNCNVPLGICVNYLLKISDNNDINIYNEQSEVWVN
jgi:hypothetical protein